MYVYGNVVPFNGIATDKAYENPYTGEKGKKLMTHLYLLF
jgi:hypothetical protein